MLVSVLVGLLLLFTGYTRVESRRTGRVVHHFQTPCVAVCLSFCGIVVPSALRRGQRPRVSVLSVRKAATEAVHAPPWF